MATVKMETFGGIAPRVHPTLLSEGMAVTAHNCRLKTGKLVPLRHPSLLKGIPIHLEGGLESVSAANSMHVWRRNDGTADILLFGGVTWLAPGNIADDERTRVVVSGDTGVAYGNVRNTPVVYMRDPESGAKEIHVIAKEALPAPKVVRMSEGDLSDGVSRYTSFFITWVDKYGYESPVSEPSLVKTGTDGSGNDIWEQKDVEYLDGDAVAFLPIGAGALPAGAVAVRVYKVVTGQSVGRIQFIKEFSRDYISDGEIGFSVDVKDESAGEILAEMEGAPADLKCIRDVPGSFWCGFSPSSPKTVMFSDVDLICSWPTAYRYDVADSLVALAVSGNTVFALTDGTPYAITGTSPSSMTVTKLASAAPCVSARGVCMCQRTVYFASHSGLMAVSTSDDGTTCTNVTDSMFTKDQWRALNPSSCIMGEHDGTLHLFFTRADGTRTGLTVSLTSSSSIALSTHGEHARCLCEDAREGKMYYVRET